MAQQSAQLALPFLPLSLALRLGNLALTLHCITSGQQIHELVDEIASSISRDLSLIICRAYLDQVKSNKV